MKGGAVVVDHTGSGGDGSGGTGGSDAAELKTLIEQFLLHLGDHEVDKVAADLAPALIVVISRVRDGQWTNSEQAGNEWIAAMRRSTTPVIFREPLTNVTVTVDSDHLAHVRADFQVMRDGKAISHGVDQFTLVREPSGWKFVVIAYTVDASVIRLLAIDIDGTLLDSNGRLPDAHREALSRRRRSASRWRSSPDEAFTSPAGRRSACRSR